MDTASVFYWLWRVLMGVLFVLFALSLRKR